MSATSPQDRTAIAADDRRWMTAALALAKRGLGTTWPNPSVGCVIVAPGEGGSRGESHVIGQGWTQAGGRPHAETIALAQAGAQARGATAYVTLEPCSHHGKTPPCAEALIAAGIKRCVVAVADPDPRVAGRGLAQMAVAGIETVTGIGAVEGEALLSGYLMRQTIGRPEITVKLGVTLDGRIATHSGHSQWITGDLARRRAHLLRARSDAILVGSRTAILDDPMLDCRLPGLEGRSPLRIVADSRLSLPLTHRLVQTARQVPVIVLARADVDADRRAAFEGAGVRVLPVGADAGGSIDMAAALRALGEIGLTRILVEGGGHVIAALLRADLVDRLALFRAPSIMGGDGLPGIAAFGIDRPNQAPRFVLEDRITCGEDWLETFRIQR